MKPNVAKFFNSIVIAILIFAMGVVSWGHMKSSKLKLQDMPSGAKDWRQLGTLVVDEKGILTGQPAAPYLADYVRKIVTEINGEDVFRLPSGAAGGNFKANVSKLIKRGDPEFLDALIYRIKSDYGVTAQKE